MRELVILLAYFIVSSYALQFSQLFDLQNVSDSVNAFALNTDTNALYVGGSFTSISNTYTNSRALFKINGTGSVVPFINIFDNGEIRSLAYQAATQTLYAAGTFTSVTGTLTNFTASYISGTWNAMPGLPGNASVNTIVLAETSIYCGGLFDDGIVVNIALWNGSSWVQAGNLDGEVFAIAYSYYDSGVWAGGSFTNYLKRWNGGIWQTATQYYGAAAFDASSTVFSLFFDIIQTDRVLVGLNANIWYSNSASLSNPSLTLFITNGITRSITKCTLGGHNGVAIGGNFTEISSQNSSFAFFDFNLGELVEQSSTVYGPINTMLEVGQTLYLGGSFYYPISKVATYAEAAPTPAAPTPAYPYWSPMDTLSYVASIWSSAFHPITKKLFIVGNIPSSDCSPDLHSIAIWNGTCFVAPYPGAATFSQASAIIQAMVFTPDGNLYLGGNFFQYGQLVGTRRILKWNSTAGFTALAEDLNAEVSFLTYDSFRNGIWAAGSLGSESDPINSIAFFNFSTQSWRCITNFPFAGGSQNAPNTTFTDYQGRTILVGMSGDVYFVISGRSFMNMFILNSSNVYNYWGNGSDSTVFGLINVPKTGNIIIQGFFETLNGQNITTLALYNPTSKQFSQLGGGVALNTASAAYDSYSDLLYVAGTYTDPQLSQVTTLNIVSGVWSRVGASFDQSVDIIALDPDNETMYAFGSFQSNGPNAVERAASFHLRTLYCPAYRCANGTCVNGLLQCYAGSVAIQNQCNLTHPYYCSGGSGQCVASASICRASAAGLCQSQFQCWNGNCVTTPAQCPPLPSCGILRVRCNDASCPLAPVGCGVQVNPCASLSQSPYLCTDGSCATNSSFCPPYDGCSTGFIRCVDGRCVSNVSACYSGAQIRCFGNVFAASAALCPPDPSLLKIIPVTVQYSSITQAVSFSVPTLYDSLPALTVTASAGAFTSNDSSCSLNFDLQPLVDSVLSNENAYSAGFDINLPSCIQFAGTVTFDIRIPANFNLTSLCLAYRNETTNKFVCTPFNVSIFSSIAPDSNTTQYYARGTTDHFTNFAILSTTTATPTENGFSLATATSNTNTLIGIAVGVAVLVLLLVGVVIVIAVLKKRSVTKAKKEASEELGMMTALKDFDDTYFPTEAIVKKEEIGAGNFGAVSRGIYHDTNVALKKLSEEDMEGFKREAATLKKLRHPNIVWYFGLWKDKVGGQHIVTEFVAGGSLRSVLRAKGPFSDKKSIGFCLETANGMTYLHSQKLIHRDLASRNLLVESGSEMHIKVADFGLTVEKSTGKDEYIAVRWSAPEVLERSEFSFASDVFAFAITMLEIYTDGVTPYGEMRNSHVTAEIQKGWRTSCPEGTPSSVFALIEACWAQDPKERLSFEKISDRLKELHANASDDVKREKVVGNAEKQANNNSGDVPKNERGGDGYDKAPTLANSAHMYDKST